MKQEPRPIVAAEIDPVDRVAAPALLIVDMQNDFVRAGAPLEVSDARATIPAQRRLVETFRIRGLPAANTRFLSLICVEETAREAFHHGYRTTVVADAVSSFAPDPHDATLKNFATKFGWVADTDTVLSWL